MRAYYPNLYGLRFFAACGVVIAHIEQMKSIYKLPNLYDLTVINSLGANAVSFFFVVSGFLAVKKLHENERTGSYDGMKSFVRRGRRIWPLYYLIVLLGFLLVPGTTDTRALPIFLMFLPNIAAIVYPSVYSSAHLWYIGVDQQFFLMFPWLAKRKIWMLFLLVALLIIATNASPIMTAFPFHLPLIGVIGGLLHDKYLPLFGKLGNNSIYRALLTLALGCVIWMGPPAYISAIVMMLSVYAFIEKPLFLESPFFANLGKLSLGIYAFHPPLLATFLWTFKGEGIPFQIALYVTTFAVSFAAAALFHRFIEPVLTGDRAGTPKESPA